MNKKTSNQQKGTTGENLATNYLIENGFIIVERNWRYKHCEIDIICKKNNKLHFIEVKTRLSKQFGNPEESINEKKMNALKKAADTNSKEAFIIGGGEIYKQAIEIADKIYLTRVHATIDGDTFFPAIDENKWQLTANQDFAADEKHAFAYSFQTWKTKLLNI